MTRQTTDVIRANMPFLIHAECIKRKCVMTSFKVVDVASDFAMVYLKFAESFANRDKALDWAVRAGARKAIALALGGK